MGIRELETARLEKLNLGQRAWCNRNLILGLDTELRKTKREDIVAKFSHANRRPVDPKKPPTSPVNDALLMRTLIWQMHLLIDAAEVPPMNGNLRSFWYRIVEPFYTKQDLLDLPAKPSLEMQMDPQDLRHFFFDGNPKDEATVQLLAAISEGGRHGAYILALTAFCMDQFVLERIFSFREPWSFRDPREAYHLIGTQTPSVIFFTEKEGLWWDVAVPISKKYGISVMASHGEPGYLTMEYFTAQLRTHKGHTLRVGTLTDYDPWGWEIADNFKAKLEEPAFGYPNKEGTTTPMRVQLTRLTSLKLFDEDVIQETKRDLTKVRKQKEVREWMKKTHGIRGECASLHVDNANPKKIMAAVEKWKRQALEQGKIDKRRPRPELRDKNLKLR